MQNVCSGQGRWRVSSRAIPGRINIGTAPLPVLRTLPTLSPTTETSAWWWSNTPVVLDVIRSLNIDPA